MIRGFEPRPRRLGELIDLTFRAYLARFGSLVPLGMTLALATTVASLGWQAVLFGGLVDATTDEGALALVGMALLGALVFLVLYVLTYSAAVVAVAAMIEGLVRGESVGLREAFRRSLRSVPSAGLATVLKGLAWVFGFLLCVLPGLFALIALSLTLPVVYFERKNPFAALGRSWELVLRRGPGGLDAETNWLRVAVIGVGTAIVVYALNLASALPVMAAQGIASWRGAAPVATPLGPQVLPLTVLLPLQLLGAAIQGVFLPLMMLPWPLVYYDIRARHEGLDLEHGIGRLERGPE